MFGLGRRSAGQCSVVGALNRTKSSPKSLITTIKKRCIHEQTTEYAVINTDQAHGYRGMKRTHGVICHRRRAFVDGTVHTNGMESFGARVKRSYKDTHHWWSRQHGQSDLHELPWKPHNKEKTLLDHMVLLVCETTEHRLTDEAWLGKQNEATSFMFRKEIRICFA